MMYCQRINLCKIIVQYYLEILIGRTIATYYKISLKVIRVITYLIFQKTDVMDDNEQLYYIMSNIRNKPRNTSLPMSAINRTKKKKYYSKQKYKYDMKKKKSKQHYYGWLKYMKPWMYYAKTFSTSYQPWRRIVFSSFSTTFLNHIFKKGESYRTNRWLLIGKYILAIILWGNITMLFYLCHTEKRFPISPKRNKNNLVNKKGTSKTDEDNFVPFVVSLCAHS